MLKDQLEDLERELQTTEPQQQARIQEEIQELQQRIAEHDKPRSAVRAA